MKYWEIEFECDDSWSISGIYAFYMRQKTEPTVEDIKNTHGVYPNHDGLGNISRIIDITDELEYYESIPDEWYDDWLTMRNNVH